MSSTSGSAHSFFDTGCETLYTEDLNPGQLYDRVLVLDPFAP